MGVVVTYSSYAFVFYIAYIFFKSKKFPGGDFGQTIRIFYKAYNEGLPCCKARRRDTTAWGHLT